MTEKLHPENPNGSTGERKPRGAARLFLLVRLALGVVFVAASIAKIANPSAFAELVADYQILPKILVNPVAVFLPWMELLIGFLLITGLWLQVARFARGLSFHADFQRGARARRSLRLFQPQHVGFSPYALVSRSRLFFPASFSRLVLLRVLSQAPKEHIGRRRLHASFPPFLKRGPQMQSGAWGPRGDFHFSFSAVTFRASGWWLSD